MEGLEIYLQAFYDLCTCRSVGMDIGPIPWHFVHEWGTINFEMPESIRDLHYHISKLDSAYLTWRSEKNKDTTK